MQTSIKAATRVALACIALASFSGPLHAQSDPHLNPYDDEAPHHGLNFGDMEYAMPTDPYLWSADPGWEPHHTPARYLTDAVEQLRAAVPAGTPATKAAAILHKAGARCGAPSGNQVQCHYNWVETPHGGEDWDNITWKVNLTLESGQVSDLAVSRDWSRRRGG